MAELRAGVAGAGVFGGFHARKYAELPGVALARVFDHDLGRARALIEAIGLAARAAEPVNDLDAFVAGLDLVTVATPGDSHAQVAGRALSAGAHVYVEKPLAVTLEDADALLAEADRRGRVLACGHQERVTFRAMGLLDAGERPRTIESVRRGQPNARNRDISCVLDLMIHDLDLALALSGGDAVAVEAEGAFDSVRAEVTFSDGLTARFEASRIAEARARTMRLDFESGEVLVDFLAPAFENLSAVRVNPDFATSSEGRDPLGVSVAAFVAAAKGAGAPIASGRDGARALDLALAVERAAGL